MTTFISDDNPQMTTQMTTKMTTQMTTQMTTPDENTI
jgi:hypothetical protein